MNYTSSLQICTEREDILKKKGKKVDVDIWLDQFLLQNRYFWTMELHISLGLTD